jgi:two-component system sensor histidine kinase/response regulator
MKCPEFELLSAYADQEVSHQERAEVESHLLHCPGCRTTLEPRQAEYAQIINNSGALLLSLIEDILDFSKMEADRLVLEEVEFELYALVEQVMQLLAPAAHSKGLEFVNCIDPDVPDLFVGDPTRVRQILVNLVGNAIKFTSHGQIKVEVRLASGFDQEARLQIRVQDTGIGVSSEQASRLFQAFQQADSSTTRRFGGTGLGLAITRNLCEHMRGSLELTSSGVGQGSLFVAEICLPRAESAVWLGQPVPPVLVIDNSPDWRQALAALLSRRGQEHACHSAGELESLPARDWHTVLVDVAVWDEQEWTARFAPAQIVCMQPLGMDAPGGRAVLTKPVRRHDLFALLEGPSQTAPLSVESPAPACPGIGENGSPSQSQGVLVLLVEDNLINQTIAMEMLESLGHEVDLAQNGREAVEMSQQRPYSIILMDCEMPEMDGFQATGVIRAREGTLQRTPIIAMTAYAMHGDRERCLQAGMDEYITKPFDLDKVSQIIEHWLAQR